MKSAKKAFTIRVYGLLINAAHEILVAEEMFKNRYMVKFPGGGLEFGESTRDCLIREFKEELGITIKVAAHFYTTDFFVTSAFDPDVQLLSIYYLVTADPSFQPPVKTLNHALEEAEIFRFVPLNEITPRTFFSFPIDQYVGELLQKS